MTSSVNDHHNNNKNSNPVTRSNGGAPNTKNAHGRGAATPNSAQKKKQGALALAGLFAIGSGGENNGEDDEVEEKKVMETTEEGVVDIQAPLPVLDTITEVVTLSSSNSGSFETTTFDIHNNLGVDMFAVNNDKRKVEEISEDPLMKYVETECGIVPPPSEQQQQMMMIVGGAGGDTSPKKKTRRSTNPADAHAHNNMQQHVSQSTVSTPQKVASILASQLPRTSVPPGVPMPQLPSVQQYLPLSSGKTSFEQLMQVSLFPSLICRHYLSMRY